MALPDTNGISQQADLTQASTIHCGSLSDQHEMMESRDEGKKQDGYSACHSQRYRKTKW